MLNKLTKIEDSLWNVADDKPITQIVATAALLTIHVAFFGMLVMFVCAFN